MVMAWIAWVFTLIGTGLLILDLPAAGYAFLVVSLAIQLLVIYQARQRIPAAVITNEPLTETVDEPVTLPQLSILNRVMTAWGQQVQVASDLVQHNIEGLIQPFNDMAARMRQENSSSLSLFGADNKDSMITRTLDETQIKLAAVIEAFHSGITHKNELQNTIANLAHYMDEMKKMAASVQMLASQTNLLALNAAIEAARQVKPDEALLWSPMRSEPCLVNQGKPAGTLARKLKPSPQPFKPLSMRLTVWWNMMKVIWRCWIAPSTMSLPGWVRKSIYCMSPDTVCIPYPAKQKTISNK